MVSGVLKAETCAAPTELARWSPVSERLPADVRARVRAALTRPARQLPKWHDQALTRKVLAELGEAAPIAMASEVRRLRARLGSVARGEAFLLQGGDCAETFADNTESHVTATVRTLSQISQAVTYAARIPVVRVGRIAGQYAKPRSSEFDENGMPVYRGDIVNSAEADESERAHDPTRMLLAHAHSSATVELLRSLAGSDASCTMWLRGPGGNFVVDPEHDDLFGGTADLAAFRSGNRRRAFAEFYTSHEALVLDYESAMLRVDAHLGRPRLYDLSGHFLWVGERTRQLDGAHIAFMELIANPIGVKIGPEASPETVLRYAERLNPRKEPGRLTLMCRMGSDRVRTVLPPIVAEVTAAGHPVIWQCDPMHGNTEKSSNGYKTRRFDRIVDEVEGFFEVHRRLGTHPGGVHLELAGEDVTECVGGPQAIAAEDLPRNYTTLCDPRLNVTQSLRLGDEVARLLRGS